MTVIISTEGYIRPFKECRSESGAKTVKVLTESRETWRKALDEPQGHLALNEKKFTTAVSRAMSFCSLVATGHGPGIRSMSRGWDK